MEKSQKDKSVNPIITAKQIHDFTERIMDEVYFYSPSTLSMRIEKKLAEIFKELGYSVEKWRTK